MNKTENEIALKLQAYKENDLTNEVIIPLLRILGYLKVDFSGGTNEEGKDIICWNLDAFGDIKLTVIQVKHFKFSKKAADEKSLQTVVNQLTTCLTKALLYTDKTSHLPNEVILISSYPIDAKTLETRFEQFPNLKDQRIKIIDGIKLASLLMIHQPELAQKLMGVHLQLNIGLKSTLNNEILLSALKYNDKKDLRHIYTDIDFSMGKITTHLFFNCSFKPSIKEVSFNQSDWQKFSIMCHEIMATIPLNFMSQSIEELDKMNEPKMKQLNEWRIEIEEFRKNSEIQNAELERRIKQRNDIEKDKERSIKKAQFDKSSKKIIEGLIEEFDVELQRANHEILLQEILSKEINENLRKKRDQQPTLRYDFKLNGEILVNSINEKRKWIEDNVKLFNKNKAKIEIKEFLFECKEIIDDASIIFNNLHYFGCLGIEGTYKFRKNYETTRFQLPIEKVFDTGLNMAVLGEAGAGKTTSLQMYALNKLQQNNQLVIWVPLGNMIQNWIKIKQKINFIAAKEFLEEGIALYLNHIGVTITPFELCSEFTNKKVILLLDGIDEAIKNAPWLPDAILFLAKKYIGTVQIIVSSRMSGEYLNNFPFFTVTLLPFTETQRNKFIENWFNDEGKDVVEKIKKHLNNNKGISEIVRNPLLTTTLCVLASHGLPLPSTELKLYDDRIRLLTGYYDNVKNIVSRIQSTPQTLEKLAQKLAFNFHMNNKREEDKDVLLENAPLILLKLQNKENSRISLLELIDPCNILVPMTDDGKFGFGHLRYQEHLAAKELLINRNIEIGNLMKQPWWKGVLILFSQMNESLSWLVKEIASTQSTYIYKDTLEAMISVRPIRERENLRSLMDQYIALETDDISHFDLNLNFSDEDE